MASSDDLIKTITERVVKYIDTPKEHRKRQGTNRFAAAERESWTTRWFGQLPAAISMWWSGRRNKGQD